MIYPSTSPSLLVLAKREFFIVLIFLPAKERNIKCEKNLHQHSFAIMEMLSSMDSVLANIDKIQLNRDKIEAEAAERHPSRTDSEVLHFGSALRHQLAPPKALWI